MSKNTSTAPGTQPDQSLPTILQEVNPADLARLGYAVGRLAFVHLPESATAHTPPRYRPFLHDATRMTLGLAAREVPHATAVLPAAQFVTEHVAADRDIQPGDLVGHMPAVRALIPLARHAIYATPVAIAGNDHKKRAEIRKTLDPIDRKLRLFRAASALAALVGQRKRLDMKAATMAATYINANRPQIRGYLAEAHDTYVAPLTERVDRFTSEFPKPREQLMQEARVLADAIWQRTDAQGGQLVNGTTVGHAIEAELRTLQLDPEAAQRQFPLLSKLGLAKLPQLPDTVALPSTFGIKMGLRLSGTPHGPEYTVTDRYGYPVAKTDIAIAHALGVAAPDILLALEAAATYSKTGRQNLNRLTDNPHPLRAIATVKSSIKQELNRVGAIGKLVRSARNLLPVDAAHAHRIIAATKGLLVPKP